MVYCPHSSGVIVCKNPKDPDVKTINTFKCMYCGTPMGKKDRHGIAGIPESICPLCLRKHYPQCADRALKIKLPLRGNT
jgi:hypothetical protein